MRSAVFALQRLRLVVPPVVRTRAEAVQVVRQCPARLASVSRLRSRPTRDFHKCHLQIGKGVAQDHRFFVCQVAARFFLNHLELIDEHPRQIQIDFGFAGFWIWNLTEK